jgi:hypothetical protein
MEGNAKADFLAKLAKTLIDAAGQQKIELRTFGGVGIRTHCRGIGGNALAERPYKNYDLDLVADFSRLRSVHRFMLASGLKEGEIGQYPGGEHRLYKWQSNGKTACTIDIYFGRLRFNHEVPAPYFDKENPYTLPITQLLLSKLAIVELTAKDKIDIISVLAEHELGDSEENEVIQMGVLRRVWCRGWESWGTARTCRLNIRAVREYIGTLSHIDALLREQVCGRLDQLEAVLNSRKSLSWKTRGFFGVKIAWYYTVEPAKSPLP